MAAQPSGCRNDGQRSRWRRAAHAHLLGGAEHAVAVLAGGAERVDDVGRRQVLEQRVPNWAGDERLRQSPGQGIRGPKERPLRGPHHAVRQPPHALVVVLSRASRSRAGRPGVRRHAPQGVDPDTLWGSVSTESPLTQEEPQEPHTSSSAHRWWRLGTSRLNTGCLQTVFKRCLRVPSNARST